MLVASTTTVALALRAGTSTGTIWSSNRPASIAATARCWLSSANASWRSRLTPQRSATFSAVSPIEYG